MSSISQTMFFGRDTEIRKLPDVILFNLACELEQGSAWKRVMGRVQRTPTISTPCPYKYTTKHINMVEEAGKKQQNRCCAEIFLEEWGCSGRRRPTLADLLSLLTDLELYKPADFVAIELLKEPRPRRPESGPAAEVHVSVNSELCLNPTAPPTSSPSEVEQKSPVVTINNSSELLPDNESARTLQQLETLPMNDHYPRHVPYLELKAITNDFNSDPLGVNSGRLLGKGAFGSVHLAIQGNQFTAVKRLEESNPEKMFQREVGLFNVDHPNILRLIGYSKDGPNRCLVYEYMSQGNVHERLSCKGRWEKPLPCPVRIRIALGTSKGLEHLHSLGFVHRDVKSENILLDKDLVPKLGDFGLSRSTDMAFSTDEIYGTDVYMAPEVFRGEVPIESDVFSFGVVLLELLTGLSPHISCDSDEIDWVTNVLSEKCIDSLLDNKVQNWLLPNGEVASDILFSLACECLEEEKNHRPSMPRVVERLTSLLQNY